MSAAANAFPTSTVGFLGFDRRNTSRPRMTMQTFAPIKPPCLYRLLGVKETASPSEIKTAYRKLAKRFHPDVGSDDGRDFMDIKEAYETLSEPAARAVYDWSRAGCGVQGARAGLRSRRWETDQCW